MFTTICLLFFLGFICWMNTSRRISWADKSRMMHYLAEKPLYSKFAAAFLFSLATLLCTFLLGTGSGIFAAMVILMLAGSVSVLFFPFRFIDNKTIVLIYLSGIVFEILFY